MLPRLLLLATLTMSLLWADRADAQRRRLSRTRVQPPSAAEPAAATTAPMPQEPLKQVGYAVADLDIPVSLRPNLDVGALPNMGPDEELVYLQDIPRTRFVGHVIERNGTMTLLKCYPLYDVDRRDGIWSIRVLHCNPMERINFKFLKNSQERHGIMIQSLWKTGRWQITWFDINNAVKQRDGRFSWNLANGRAEIFSDEQISRFGLHVALIEWQNFLVNSR